MTRKKTEWIKRIAVLVVVVLTALALREWAIILGLSRWVTTLISPAIYVAAFWFADLALDKR